MQAAKSLGTTCHHASYQFLFWVQLVTMQATNFLAARVLLFNRKWQGWLLSEGQSQAGTLTLRDHTA